MRLLKDTIPKFLKLCIYSGIFTIISFICFSMVYHFTNPEIETFTRFAKNHALRNWAMFNILNVKSLLLLLVLLVTTIVASGVGFAAAIFAKALHDKAAEVLKSGIES